MDVTLQTRADGSPILVWRYARACTTCSTGPHGGGLGLRSWAFNAQVPTGYSHPDPDAHCAEMAVDLGLAGEGVGLLTAAAVDAWTRGEDDGVVVAATVGLGQPEWAAAPPSSSRTGVGTINVLAWVPERVSDAALVNAVATITEAKVQALVEAGIDGSGTATDAVVVACPADGYAHAYGGPRSRWGAPLARAAHAAIRRGIGARHSADAP